MKKKIKFEKSKLVEMSAVNMINKMYEIKKRDPNHVPIMLLPPESEIIIHKGKVKINERTEKKK